MFSQTCNLLKMTPPLIISWKLVTAKTKYQTEYFGNFNINLNTHNKMNIFIKSFIQLYNPDGPWNNSYKYK